MREFQEKGFEQASMKAVADAVGTTSAARDAYAGQRL